MLYIIVIGICSRTTSWRRCFIMLVLFGKEWKHTLVATHTHLLHKINQWMDLDLKGFLSLSNAEEEHVKSNGRCKYFIISFDFDFNFKRINFYCKLFTFLQHKKKNLFLLRKIQQLLFSNHSKRSESKDTRIRGAWPTLYMHCMCLYCLLWMSHNIASACQQTLSATRSKWFWICDERHGSYQEQMFKRRERKEILPIRRFKSVRFSFYAVHGRNYKSCVKWTIEPFSSVLK